MKAVDANFLALLGSSQTQFVIPVYQRVYSWEERECADLWDDLMRAGRQGNQHFIGSFLYTPQSDSTATSLTRELLIDGQQRMTTLSLMLAALFDWLEEDDSRASFLTDIKVSALRKHYLYNADDYLGDSRYRLVLTQTDRETLFRIVSKSPLPNERSERIVAAYQLFKDRISGKGFDAEALWRGISNALIIDAKLNPDTDNAQLIFESMNSKGKPLTAIDLIRNFILMSLPASEQSKLYEDYWRPIEMLFGQEHGGEFNAFVWYWLWLKVPMRKPREDQAYAEFKRYCQDQNLSADPAKLLAELRTYAHLYVRMFLDGETDKDLARHFRRIATLDVKPIRPLMLELYHIYATDQQRLSKAAFERILTYLESFLFRRSVIGRFSTGLNNFFAGMYRQLEATTNPEEYVIAMLLVNGPGLTAYFPTDDDFASSLRTRDLYHRFPKVRYCLERFESYHSPKEQIPTGEYQIEHIMPQEISHSDSWKAMLGPNWEADHEELCNTLGNLTLTGYNQEYSNSPFDTKLNLTDIGFKASHLYLNGWVAKQTAWNRGTIERRSALLAADALAIWPYPHTDSSIVDKYRPKKAEKGFTSWTLEEDHPLLAKGGICSGLFDELCSEISEQCPDWDMYVTKYYVGFRTGKCVRACVEGRNTNGGWLAMGLNAKTEDLEDPQGLCQGKSFGPGLPTRVDLTNEGQLPSILALLCQC